MKLIFNTTLMQQSMESLSYDSKKLPLGKLSKTTILAGYEVLKKLGDVITNPHNSSNYSQYGNTHPEILKNLSSQYYVSFTFSTIE